MLTNDNNFNEKKQMFLHKICNFVIKFLIFADFMRFLPIFYTNIQNPLCITLQIFIFYLPLISSALKSRICTASANSANTWSTLSNNFPLKKNFDKFVCWF